MQLAYVVTILLSIQDFFFLRLTRILNNIQNYKLILKYGHKIFNL